jgi:hypothetical protein
MIVDSTSKARSPNNYAQINYMGAKPTPYTPLSSTKRNNTRSSDDHTKECHIGTWLTSTEQVLTNNSHTCTHFIIFALD